MIINKRTISAGFHNGEIQLGSGSDPEIAGNSCVMAQGMAWASQQIPKGCTQYTLGLHIKSIFHYHSLPGHPIKSWTRMDSGWQLRRDGAGWAETQRGSEKGAEPAQVSFPSLVQ